MQAGSDLCGRRGIMERNISVIKDVNGNKIVVINDIRFKGRQNIDWDEVEQYLKHYVGEFVEIAENKRFRENLVEKHNKNARFGWYRYDSRFALPIFDDDGEVLRYNVFHVELVIRHAMDRKLYLYDIINIKKETSTPLEP